MRIRKYCFQILKSFLRALFPFTGHKKTEFDELILKPGGHEVAGATSAWHYRKHSCSNWKIKRLQ